MDQMNCLKFLMAVFWTKPDPYSWVEGRNSIFFPEFYVSNAMITLIDQSVGLEILRKLYGMIIGIHVLQDVTINTDWPLQSILSRKPITTNGKMELQNMKR